MVRAVKSPKMIRRFRNVLTRVPNIVLCAGTVNVERLEERNVQTYIPAVVPICP